MDKGFCVNFCEDLLLNSIVAMYANSALWISDRLYNYTIGGMSTGLLSRFNVIDMYGMESILRIIETIGFANREAYSLIKLYLIDMIVGKIREISDGFTSIDSELGKYI